MLHAHKSDLLVSRKHIVVPDTCHVRNMASTLHARKALFCATQGYGGGYGVGGGLGGSGSNKAYMGQ